MRYQDWDVLLFPHGSDIPIQEFRTECFAVEDCMGVTPTVQTFIPTMPRGALFRVSVHSWTPPNFSASMSSACLKAWAIRIIIDGVIVSSETFGQDDGWPNVIGSQLNLAFPPFHRSILNQRSLQVADYQGRIKIALSEGYIHQGNPARFEPLRNIVTFSYLHAPLAKLQSSNVAWPNPYMAMGLNMAQLDLKQPFGQTSYAVFNATGQATHRHNQSSRDSGFFSNSSMPTPPGSDHPFGNPEFLSSMDSSNYSYSDGYGEPVLSSVSNPLQSTLQSDVKPTQLPVRLPSDQVRQIVGAFSAVAQGAQVAGVSMADIVAPTTGFEAEGRRKISMTSDVSMHASCTQFPGCTVDAPDGTIVHSPSSDILSGDLKLNGRKRNRTVRSDGETDFSPLRKISKGENIGLATTAEEADGCSIS